LRPDRDERETVGEADLTADLEERAAVARLPANGRVGLPPP